MYPASLGIDLSAASTVIFAELPPDAAWLAQAEDRCHRKGQRAAVNVTILLAHATDGGAESLDGSADATPDGAAEASSSVRSRLASQVAACRFDARHAAGLKQSERAVRRVTDGPQSKRATSSSRRALIPVDDSPTATAEEEATTQLVAVEDCSVAVEDCSVLAVMADEEAMAVRFECSALSGRIHLFLSPHAAPVTAATSSSAAWWTHHTSFTPDDLPAATAADANATAAATADATAALAAATSPQLPNEVSMPAAADDATLKHRLHKMASTFLCTWRALTAYQRRQLRGRPLQATELSPLTQPASGATHAEDQHGNQSQPVPAALLASSAPSKSPSRRRARPRLEANEGAPEGMVWGVAHVPPRYRASSAMPLALSADGSRALCLACYATLALAPTGLAPSPRPSPTKSVTSDVSSPQKPLRHKRTRPGSPVPDEAAPPASMALAAPAAAGTPSRTSSDAPTIGSPGAPTPAAALARPDDVPEARPLSDAELFCSGSCRANYFGQRCSGSLRRQLGDLDGATCAVCSLDAAAVCQALCEAPPGAARTALLQRLAPRIAASAKLSARLVEAPQLAGNCWHADHVQAVADGGGECSVDNMQVLCVACHQDKSTRERRERREREQRGAGDVPSAYFSGGAP